MKFLADFLDASRKSKVIGWLHDLITNTSRLVDPKGNNIFANRFAPLYGQNATELYQDILKVFQCDNQSTFECSTYHGE